MNALRGWIDFSQASAGPAWSAGSSGRLRAGDGSVQLAADARLDNRKELVRALGADAALSDAGLILAAYLRWGDDCAGRLLGDFAFALWDVRRRRLLCACDPLGIRTLHYARVGSLTVFASEARQVLQHPAVPRLLDEEMIGDYLAGFNGEPGKTFFREVHRLPPAHRLLAGPDGDRIDRYWDLDPEARTAHRRDEDYAEHFLDVFRRAVECRMPPDGGAPGVLMSGGLDSGSVAAMARDVLPGGSAARLFAGSFVFDRLRQCDEREHIQAVAAHLGLDREYVEAERFPILGDPDAYRPSLETPFLAWEGCFQEMLRRTRDRGARVLLTGHGGDDLLSGSPLVYADRLRRGDLRAVLEVARHAAGRGRAWRWVLYNFLLKPLLPARADRLLTRLSGRATAAAAPAWIDPAFTRRTGLAERLQSPPPRHPRQTARQALYEHFRQTPWDQVVHWYDRNATPMGIEMRHPFLDRRLVELLLSFPPEQLFRAGTTKPLLRLAMAGRLPDPVRLRPDKTRLGAFLDLAFQGDQGARIDALLEEPLVVDLGYLDGERFRTACRRYRRGRPEEYDRSLWYAVTLEAWLRHYATFLGLDSKDAESRPAA